ncbi:transcription factor SPEECHLESS [Impatiens glandulifera]|uniref:transcription factor SPEECHLESS n=1 Tax=Impatiens glandulifera TaxID=253017 RepID=UPI001FB0763B|nr:transcription factor SPEECHLESS [Impatiens glandulifera]
MSSCDDNLWIDDFFNMDDHDSDFGETNSNNILHYNLEDQELLIPPNLGLGAEVKEVVAVDHDIQIQAAQGMATKRRKVTSVELETSSDRELIMLDDQQQQIIKSNNIAHITVERNRRKQMNQNLSLLRSLMPSFYVKRGDQASIIGGVIDYINELQLILQSLEAKKQRKVIYNQVLSPSPRNKPPLSPRVILPMSPKTPQPTITPYKLKPPSPAALEPPSIHSPSSSSGSLPNVNLVVGSSTVCVNELAASSKSAMADVEVKFSGENNLLLKTASLRIPGQAFKIISALEKLALQILHVNISTVDHTMLNSFTIKIGIECQLSAEELAQQVQQTFC